AAAENILIGNVSLYGATAGELYVNGQAGERFAVRNSGATAVVEGVGDHGCEYMTGGTIVILGDIGRNFGAGMSGGTAYIHASEPDVERYLNAKGLSMETCGGDYDPQTPRDREMLQRLLENHYRYTGSQRAKQLLDRWPQCLHEFIRILPDAYQAAVMRFRERGEDILPPLPMAATKEAPDYDHVAAEVDE
ncbi:MAG: glutamate synthase subunit alpha, partial [Gammaproteobacteria bacterium]|nr:glutamate synthase subunit alpha [Gammaproteobacteria bacterium]